MNELREEIASLEAQEEIIQSKLSEELDDNRAQELMNDLNIVRNKKSEKTFELQQAIEKEQQREEAIEERIHADEVPFAITGVDISGFPVEVIQFVEEVVKTDRKRIYNEHAIELEQAEIEYGIHIGGLEASIESQDKIIEHGTADNNRLIRENGDLRDHSFKQHTEIEDLTNKLANASALLSEKDAEIYTLSEKLAEYERNAEYAERQEQPLTVSPEESTSLQEKADAVKKLFKNVEDWGSILKVTKTDDTIELVKRADLVDWKKATDVPNNEPNIEPPTHFQSEDAAVQEHTADREVATDADKIDNGGEVTRAELEQRLRQIKEEVKAEIVYEYGLRRNVA